MILAEVIDVDVQGQRALTPERAIPSDPLILATGARYATTLAMMSGSQ